MGHPRPLFLFFVFSILPLVDKILPMCEFEPQISGVGSDCSTNWATTTAHSLLQCLNENKCFQHGRAASSRRAFFDVPPKKKKHWLYLKQTRQATFCLFPSKMWWMERQMRSPTLMRTKLQNIFLRRIYKSISYLPGQDFSGTFG